MQIYVVENKYASKGNDRAPVLYTQHFLVVAELKKWPYESVLWAINERLISWMKNETWISGIKTALILSWHFSACRILSLALTSFFVGMLKKVQRCKMLQAFRMGENGQLSILHCSSSLFLELFRALHLQRVFPV